MVQWLYTGTIRPFGRPFGFSIAFWLAWCCILGFTEVPKASAEGPRTIYFYSSEANINNYKALKMEFDGYLSKSGAYEFQPFSDIHTFEKQIRKGTGHLLLLSSWHYSRIHKDLSLKPVLVGIRGGRSFQKRVLVAGPGAKGLNSVGSGPVASASSVQYTRSVLEGMYDDSKKADSVRILTVPKDVDALMSVGFEMAKAAVTTENALRNLENLDPALFKRIRTLAEGNPSLLLILAAPADEDMDIQGLIRAVREMPDDPTGLNALKMLDLDGWKTMDPSDTLKLEG